MATYTSNYQLHQWVPEDDFLRTDFNTDFQKIDAALAGLEAGKAGTSDLTALQSGVAAAQSTANSKCRVILGSYAGSGTFPRSISVGGAPKAVIIALENVTVSVLKNAGECRGVTITSSGFTLSSSYDGFNLEGHTYYYIAIV